MSIGMYKVTAKDPTTVIPGNWYRGFDCSCGFRLAVFDDEHRGKSNIKVLDNGSFYCICPSCRAPGYYLGSALINFQQP